MDPEIDNMPEFPDFGTALRFYREHIADRIRKYVPGRLPDIQLTAKDVVSCMREAGYSISQAAYSDIEQGQYLPRDPEVFFATVVSCLALDQDSPEYNNLMDHLAYDVLKQKLGAEKAARYWKPMRSVYMDNQTAQPR